MEENKGFWLVVEGIDGAGKTSAMNTIEHFFKMNHLKYMTLREPGGSPLGESIRSIFKTKDLEICPISQVLLMYAARVQLLNHVILPALNQGCSVILDRHELSTYAYQSGGAKVDSNTIDSISQAVMPVRKPDLTLYLFVRPEVSHMRIEKRGEGDHFDQNSREYFVQVLLKYEECITHYPNIIVIDANQDYEQVQSDIKTALKTWFAKVEHV